MLITYHAGVKDIVDGYKLLGCKDFITHFDTCLDKESFLYGLRQKAFDKKA